MKTKEVDVWVHNAKKIDMCDHVTVKTYNPMNSFYNKAKLIIEIPEKKIEITGKLIDDAHNNFYESDLYNSNYTDAILVDFIKKELGF